MISLTTRGSVPELNFDLILQNFLRFKKRTYIPIRQYTILVGPNGSGKSTILSGIKLFNLTLLTLLDSAEVRKRAFVSENLYKILKTEKEKFIIGKVFYNFDEKQSRDYLEFVYCKDGDFIDLDRLEYGFITPDSSKKNFFTLQIKLTKSNYLNSLTLSDDEWYGKFDEFDDKIYDDLLKIYNHPLIREESIFSMNRKTYKGIGLVTYLLNDILEEFDKYKNLNLDLLKFLIFNKPSFKYKSEEEKFLTTFRYNRKREPTALDYFVDKFGLNELKNLSAYDLYYHIKISAKVEIELISIIDNLRENEEVETIELVDLGDTREEPPKYLEIEKGIVKKDYHHLWEEFSYYKECKNNKDNIQIEIYKQGLKKFYEVCKKFEIADKIIIKKVGGIRSEIEFYKIFLKYNNSVFEIKNLSSGGRQLLPIILELFTGKKRLILRQPELHVHPRLQMQIPDLLVLADTDVILETHSEHIIRKFQLLISQKKIPNIKKVSIIYVKPNKGDLSSSIKLMELDDNGNFINEWPGGFFDEAAELSYALLESQVNRKN